MTLRVPEPTEASVETVRSHLSELAGRTAFRRRALARANPAGLALAAPHDVYSLGLRDLAEGASLDAATVDGRRFIVMDGDKPIASAELADRGEAPGSRRPRGPTSSRPRLRSSAPTRIPNLPRTTTRSGCCASRASTSWHFG